MTEFRFLHPWALLALVVPIALLVYELRNRMARRPSLLFSDVSVLDGIRPTWRQRVDAALPYVRCLALCLGVLAMARPQLGTTERTVRSVGVDISLVIDVSGSMQALDLKPNRLEAAKKAAADFVAQRESDRVSLVVFAQEFAVLCPPTLDLDAVHTFISSIQEGIISDVRTGIGMGLAQGVRLLKDSTAKSRVVILLTDGVNNTGKIQPIQAAEAARNLGIRVYTIGVGGRGPARIPARDNFGRQVIRLIDADVDESTLTEVATMTGGRYFRADSADTLLEIYREINALERSSLSVEQSTDFDEKFFLLWLPGLALLGLELLARALVLRRLP